MRTKEFAAAAWRRFYDWKTEHQFLGRYSVDKLQQFDRYQAQASLARCLGVIGILSILPTFALLVGLHAIPVAPPDLGVARNIAAVVRSAIGHAVFTIMWVFYMAQSRGTTKEGNPKRIFVHSVLAGGFLPEGLWIPVSLLWRYPVPGSGFVKMIVSLGCIILINRCSETTDFRATNRQRTRILTIVMTEYLLIVIFFLLLIFAFVRSPGGAQLALILIHPPLRSLLKKQSWVYARKLNDLSTDVTLNIVDMSAAMYQALCIQYVRYRALIAVIVLEELILGIAVAQTYSKHTFIVDGQRTLQTAIKIVEGSLSSTLVVEEDESETEELVVSDDTYASQATEEGNGIITQKIDCSKSSETLRWSSLNTMSLTTGSSSANGSEQDREEAKLQPKKPSRGHATEKNAIRYDTNSCGAQFSPKSVQTLRRAASSDMASHVHLGLAKTSEVQQQLSPTNMLRRISSDKIPESKFAGLPIPKTSFSKERDGKGGNKGELRLQSWSRDASKVHCFSDVRQEGGRPPSSPKPKQSSQGRCSSNDLPPLGDLQAPNGFGRHASLQRPTSVFLTPRVLMKSGSKRLLDLGRNSNRSAYTVPGDIHQQSDIRKPTQVNIDGMLIVRKDQARILEQTLQLLFSCEVLVVTEFVKVVVPLLEGLLLITLWNLPSSRYNVLLRDTSREEIMARVLWCLCFAAFELPALVLVCVVVFKKYGISPLHLLAFLLEQQYANFQTKVMSCFIALIFSTSVHQGMNWVSK